MRDIFYKQFCQFWNSLEDRLAPCYRGKCEAGHDGYINFPQVTILFYQQSKRAKPLLYRAIWHLIELK